MGRGVALVYVIATVAMAFTAFSYASQMVRVVPRAGSVFAYVRGSCRRSSR